MPRDIASRAAKAVCDEGLGVGHGGRGVYLDFSDAIGRLGTEAIATKYGNLFEIARENGFDEMECERHLFEVDHCAAGEWLALSWNLPTEFVGAIAHHHDAEATDTSLPSLVRASSDIADALGYNVMQVRRTEAIADIIGGLPIPDKEAAASKLADFGDQIQATIGSVTPSSSSS